MTSGVFLGELVWFVFMQCPEETEMPLVKKPYLCWTGLHVSGE